METAQQKDWGEITPIDTRDTNKETLAHSREVSIDTLVRRVEGQRKKWINS